MAPEPAERRRAERRRALAGLRADAEHWRLLTRPGASLPGHGSQVDAVLAMLAPAVARAEAAIEEGAGGTGADGVLVLVQDLFHVWDFFRNKLTLRQTRAHRRWLEAADELAWAVYRPALDAAAGRMPPREPPLTGFGRAVAPLAHRRGEQYRELLPRGGVHTRAGRDLVARLPFPVIDVPWWYQGHLPAVLTVAHEAGHHLEDDFGLTGELAARIAGAGLPGDRAAHWARWAGEVFADACGALACGAAFADVLEDRLAGLPDDGGEGPHPPPALRVAFCRLVAGGGPAPGPGAGEPAAVAAALLTEGYPQFGGLRLDEVIGPAPGDADEGAARLLAGRSSGGATVGGVLAAAATAFRRDPAGHLRARVDERVLTEVLALRPDTARSAGRAGSADAPERDAAAGRALLAALGF
ncbi:hypothetical protein ACFVHB_00285 [Kitasatospora sp. NPDC127111]|uniref:hypothetical protein n=1 Tax=Kitasatospora sp. NPDC127111 TaxID=3345363 RepID=UPI00362C33F9